MEWMLMPLKRYADFSGRSRRMEFWMWVVFQVLIAIAFMVLMVVLGGAALAAAADPSQMFAAGGVVIVLYLLYVLVGLAFFIPNLAVTVRRLHDTDRSGWWIMLFWGPYLLMLITPFVLGGSIAAGGDGAAGGALAIVAMLAFVIGSIVLLVFMFLEGTRGPNSYGADPKGVNASQVFT